jgi:hypothetical protein
MAHITLAVVAEPQEVMELQNLVVLEVEEREATHKMSLEHLELETPVEVVAAVDEMLATGGLLMAVQVVLAW